LGLALWLIGIILVSKRLRKESTFLLCNQQSKARDFVGLFIIGIIALCFGLASCGLDPSPPKWDWRPDYPILEKDFSIVVMPDTQSYVEQHADINRIQTRWIGAYKDILKIKFVAHVGDLVTHYGYLEGKLNEAEWAVADSAMATLEQARIPYGIAKGNHDFDHFDSERKSLSGTSVYNRYFGIDRIKQAYPQHYGEPFDSTNDNYYMLLDSGDEAFILFFLAFDGRYQNTRFIGMSAPPSDPMSNPVIRWVDHKLGEHADRKAIIVSHYVLNAKGELAGLGKALYPVLTKHDNPFLMLGGHRLGLDDGAAERYWTDGQIGVILANFQSIENGGNGWLKVMTFSPARNTIFVRTYSPWLDLHQKTPVERIGPHSKFEIPYPFLKTNAGS
jgi:hypothetical protein